MNPFASSPLQLLELFIKKELEPLVLPVMIRCVIRQHVLFIVLDYAVVENVDAQMGLQGIHRAVSRFLKEAPEYLRQIQFQGDVKCYWRKQGEQTPLVKHSFRYRLPQPLSMAPLRKLALDESPPSIPSQLSVPRQTNTGTDIPPKSSVFVSFWQRLSFSGWRWEFGMSVAIAVAAVGVASYAWSRPCVSDRCTILEQAQSIHSSLSLESDASAEEVAQTYTTLLDIHYQLGQVPLWSPRYDEVKQLLNIYENHTHLLFQVLGAQEQAKAAIAASQAPPYPVNDWQKTQEQWQGAIQTLEPVSQGTIVAPLVQTQLQDYNTKLQSIEHHMQQEKTAFNQVKAARKFARMAEMNSSRAVSLEDLEQSEAHWQQALDHLTDVLEETMAYAEAEHLKVIYTPQLLSVRDRLAQETIAKEAYHQAIDLADRSVMFEQEQQWSLAVQHWQQAIESINQVPENTAYHEQVFPLASSYTTALTNAQDHLTKVVAIQQAKEDLTQRCSAMSDICEAVTVDNTLQVWLAADVNDVTEPVRVSPPSPALKPNLVQDQKQQLSPRLVSQDINTWVRTIAAVGKTRQVSINVYNPDGTMLGTYSPDTARFVRTAMTVETEVDTTVASVPSE